MKAILALLWIVASSDALYSSSDDVIELTASNFQRDVIQSDDLWLVEFYAPWCGHCKSLAPEWKKVASALKGIVKVGAVDSDQHQSLGRPYGVSGFPTIKVFGSNKNSPTDYKGARQAQGIVDSAMSALKSMVSDRLKGGKSSGGSKQSSGGGGGSKQGNTKAVIELTDANFDKEVFGSEDMWLVEFFAPWCGHCKNLEPEWAKAAGDLKGKVKLGAVDATVHTVIASRFGVQVYPTILLFPSGLKTMENVEAYSGGHTASAMVDWTLDRYLSTAPTPELHEVRGYPTIKYFPAGKKSQDMVEDFDGGRTASDIVSWAESKVADNISPPEVLELTSGDILKSSCDDYQLCIISFLPNILDCQSKCRNDYIAMLTRLGDKYKKRVWGWVWAEAVAQPALEEAVGIGGFGYPAMVAVNSRKKIYSLLKGSFSEDGLNEFLRALAVGRGTTAPLRGSELPTVETRAAWDGKDGELPEEEDIDLSDVFLDDLDDDKDEL